MHLRLGQNIPNCSVIAAIFLMIHLRWWRWRQKVSLENRNVNLVPLHRPNCSVFRSNNLIHKKNIVRNVFVLILRWKVLLRLFETLTPRTSGRILKIFEQPQQTALKCTTEWFFPKFPEGDWVGAASSNHSVQSKMAAAAAAETRGEPLLPSARAQTCEHDWDGHHTAVSMDWDCFVSQSLPLSPWCLRLLDLSHNPTWWNQMGSQESNMFTDTALILNS